MDTKMNASSDASTYGDIRSPRIGITTSALPEAKNPDSGKSSQIGVSTRNALSRTISKKNIPHWFALRTTYGREKKAYEYIIAHNGTAFYPTITTKKVINGKKQFVEVSRIPNIFFAYGTEEAIKSFVYDNINLPYLRFYYKHFRVGAHMEKTPMIIPDNQMRNLQIICENEDADTLILQEEVTKFKQGEKVKIIEGDFSGVTGIVARYQGQQRVGLVIDGLLTAVTAYIPTAFLERIV